MRRWLTGFWVDATMPADREREAEEAKRKEEARRAHEANELTAHPPIYMTSQ